MNTNKYEKLTSNLSLAIEKATEVAAVTDDNGTCNFDSCVLLLPRWNEKETLNAIKAAGVRGFKSSFLGKQCYFIVNPVSAQGNRNTVQAEKIANIMSQLGYEAYCYMQMD